MTSRNRLIRPSNRSLIVALATLFAATGCESGSTPAPSATGSAAAPATAAPTGAAKGKHAKDGKPGKGDKDRKRRGDKRRKRDRRGGPQMMVKVAMDTLELTDEQRGKLEALGPDKPSDEAIAARKASKKALADAVRSGSIDVDALMKAAPEQKHEDMVERLNTLHATLTPEQRTGLVATLRDKGDRKRDKGDRKRDKGDRAHEHEHEHEGGEAHDHDHAHGKDGDHDHEHGEGHDRDRKMGGRRSPLGKVLRGIELSEEQTTKIKDALDAAKLASDDEGSGKGARKKEAHQALLEAFTKDDFDAATVLAGSEGRQHRRHLERLAVVVPLLDEGQRNELADRIESGEGRKKRGGKGSRRE